jgi:deoxyribonuclease V
MIIKQLHEWRVTTSEAMSIQRQLAPKVSANETHLDVNVHHVAGVDVAVHGTRKEGNASVVILTYPGLTLVEQSTYYGTIEFPYVPGLLSFREAPLLLKALEKLKITPDIVLVDGQGFAHPRRFGLASHLGLILDIPTIGCAKSRLCGTYEEPCTEAGCFSDLMDSNEVIGAVVRTRTGTRPVYVSVGHKISLRQAVEWTLKCCRGFRLPEPARFAHQVAGGNLPKTVQALVK